jgi:MFS family permease
MSDAYGSVTTADLLMVTGAAIFGAWAEVYDFIVAGPISTIVWPTVFFPSVSPALALMAGVSAMLISLAGRPVGSWIFGHIGDRFGRKTTLVWTLFTVGIGTLVIILLPGYSAIGILAPIALILARFVVGIGFGGEFGSTSTWVLEVAAHRKRRGFWAGILGQAYTVGPLTAASVVTAILASVGLKEFMAFWWRVPFMIALVVVIVGAIVRYETMESPIFRRIASAGRIVREPFVDLLRKMPKKWLLVTGAAIVSQVGFFTGNTIMIAYITSILKLPAAFATYTFVTGEIVAVVIAFVNALLVDVMGRKRLLLVLTILSTAFAVPYGYMISTGVPLYILLAQTVVIGLASGIPSIQTSFLAENFPPQYRVTGSGTAWQFSILFGTVPESYLMLYLMRFGRVSAIYISVVMLVVMAISLASIAALRETKGTALE